MSGSLSLDRKIQEKSLGLIADSMAVWEGTIADYLDLTTHDVAFIKEKHPKNLKLQL